MSSRRSRSGISLVALTLALVFARGSSGRADESDIVLYASDVSTIQGNWARVSATGAAGGQQMMSTDKGWSATDAPLVGPVDYFEAIFSAPSATTYHVWLRLRASGNSKWNDSVWVQFSDATTTSGSATYRLGTSSGLLVNLEPCKDCGVNGWGWQDKGYWLAQPALVQFSASGSHTIRVQTREDGAQIDQIVLSPATYLSMAPGQGQGDSTIVAKPPAPPPPAPDSPAYSGTPVLLPGVVQAENFDVGADGVAYHDSTPGNSGNAYRGTDVDIEPASSGGYDVGWTDAGEWLNYSVNVAAAGSYAVDFRVASLGQGGSFHLEMNGANVTGSMTVPNTGGWQNWQTVSKTVALTAGPQVMRLAVDARGPTATGNFDSITFTAIAAPGGFGPAAPNSPNVAPGTAGVTVTPCLSWLAAGATSYDLLLSTANPPAMYVSNVSTSWYSPTTLAGGATYYWQVVAKNSSGSTPGPVWSFTTVSSAPGGSGPAVPNSPNVAPGTVGVTVTPSLSWQAAGATSYDLLLSTANPPAMYASNISSSWYAPATLAGGATYYWQVVAKNATGSTPGPVWSFTTVGSAPGGSGPAVPNSPNVAPGTVSVTVTPCLSWQAAGATSYDLLLSTANPPAMYVSNISTSWYSPTTLTGGATYDWQVVAKNTGGSTPGPIWSFTTASSAPGGAAPAVPNSPNVAPGAAGVTVTPSLSWQAAGATSYDLLLSTANPPAMYASNISTSWYATTTALAGGTTYYWQVVAKNTGGSTPGPVWSFTTASSAPGGSAPAVPNSPNVAPGAAGVTVTPSLSWQAAGATSYDLLLSTANPPAMYASNISTSWYATTTALAGGTTYYWRVVAKNTTGSTTGPVWSFTTAGSPGGSGGTFRLMQWNVQSGKNLSGTYDPWSQVQLMVAQGADIICLDEIETWMADEPTLFKSYLEQLTGRTWYAVYAPNTPNAGTIGDLLLSKFPIVQQNVTILQANPGNPSDYLGNRAALRALVNVGGVPINIIGTHLDYANSSYRTTQLSLLLPWAAGFGGPRLMAGDFNSWWGEYWPVTIMQTYSDTWQDVTGSNQNGYTIGNVRYDYVFRAFDQNSHVTATSVSVVNTTLSDHRPVVADFRIQ